MSSDVITLSRTIEGIRIPEGISIELPEGTEVVITQALGTSYTVAVHGQGGLYRIDAKHGDALGRDPNELLDAVSDAAADGDEANEDTIWAQLKTCYDPEIPVNIVDLGLIYDLSLEKEDDGLKVTVQMTLTAPGCGMGPSIAADAQHKILSLPGVKDAEVALVWDPPWTPDRISEEGKAKLGMA